MRTELQRALRGGAALVPIALLHIAGPAAGQQPNAASRPVGISLAPSVVMLKGQPGQAYKQTLRLTNHTSREMAFRLEAQDVVADSGRRVFVAAGERADSVAATAVFSPKQVVVAPGAVGTADLTITMPARTLVRGVAAVFRGETVVGDQRGVAMTASLGALITFTLSDDIQLEASAPEVAAQTDTTNLSLAEWVTNTGSEPVVASGAAAVLNATGVLVGRVPVEPQRLMPGERLPFRVDYPALLGPGTYRALLSLEYDGNERKVLTRTVDFEVPAVRDDRRIADRGTGVRP